MTLPHKDLKIRFSEGGDVAVDTGLKVVSARRS
jgi:hypothetical protein